MAARVFGPSGRAITTSAKKTTKSTSPASAFKGVKQEIATVGADAVPTSEIVTSAKVKPVRRIISPAEKDTARDRFIREIDAPYFTELLTGMLNAAVAARDSTKAVIRNTGPLPQIDDDDRSAVTGEMEINAAKAGLLHEQVLRIDGALQRISLGTFGICSFTGQSMSYDFLADHPLALRSPEGEEEYRFEQSARGPRGSGPATRLGPR